MGRVRTYEEALEAHRKWKEVQARKKARKEQQRLRYEEELKKASERNKKREEKRLEEERKIQEKREKYLFQKEREVPMDDWFLQDKGIFYTEYELRHIEELYPNETGRINWEWFDKQIERLRKELKIT